MFDIGIDRSRKRRTKESSSRVSSSNGNLPVTVGSQELRKDLLITKLPLGKLLKDGFDIYLLSR